MLLPPIRPTYPPILFPHDILILQKATPGFAINLAANNCDFGISTQPLVPATSRRAIGTSLYRRRFAVVAPRGLDRRSMGFGMPGRIWGFKGWRSGADRRGGWGYEARGQHHVF